MRGSIIPYLGAPDAPTSTAPPAPPLPEQKPAAPFWTPLKIAAAVGAVAVVGLYVGVVMLGDDEKETAEE